MNRTNKENTKEVNEFNTNNNIWSSILNQEKILSDKDAKAMTLTLRKLRNKEKDKSFRKFDVSKI